MKLCIWKCHLRPAATFVESSNYFLSNSGLSCGVAGRQGLYMGGESFTGMFLQVLHLKGMLGILNSEVPHGNELLYFTNVTLNTLRSRQNGCHFEDDILKLILALVCAYAAKNSCTKIIVFWFKFTIVYKYASDVCVIYEFEMNHGQINFDEREKPV